MLTLEDRILAVEKSNRRLRVVLCGVLVVAGSLVTMAAMQMQDSKPSVHDIVRTRQLEIVDETGTTTVSLFSIAEQGCATFASRKKITAVIGSLSGNGIISTLNQDGTDLVTLTSSTGGHGILLVHNKYGKELVTLTATEGGNDGVVSTFNKDGKKLVTLAATEGGTGSVTTFDQNGTPCHKLATTVTGEPPYAVFNRAGGIKAQFP